ncbi:MAG: toprim domain-containing protein [Candidatus Dojkabacteria bacterium]|nr:toprim domain-containing protein [Candidatus Dojkabacteria bacterium]
MDIVPKELMHLISFFQNIEGVGSKLGQKLSYSIILEPQKIDELVNILHQVRLKVGRCTICGNIATKSENNKFICSICNQLNTRNSKQLMIVENVFSLLSFESLGFYNGHYHIVGRLVHPTHNIDDLNFSLSSLVSRIIQSQYEEIIFGLSNSLEAELTISLILKLLKDNKLDFKNVRIYKLASGIPSGVDIENVSNKSLLDSLRNKILIDIK